MHGFLVDDTLWSDVPERLADAGSARSRRPGRWDRTHRHEARPDLSPRGVARVVASFLEAMDLHDVMVVGSDTGGAIHSCCLTRTGAGWVGWC